MSLFAADDRIVEELNDIKILKEWDGLLRDMIKSMISFNS